MNSSENGSSASNDLRPMGRWGLWSAYFCYGVFRPEPPPQLFQDSDKLWHVLAFIGLSVSTRLAFTRISGWLLWPLLFGLAPLVEGLQQWLQASRHFSLGDIQANLLGVFVALLLFGALHLLRRAGPANP